jgi:hypothetical protein
MGVVEVLVIVPELEILTSDPKPMDADEPVKVMFPPVLLNIAVCIVLELLPVDKEQEVRVILPLFDNTPVVVPPRVERPPEPVKLIVLPAPMVRVVVLCIREEPQVVVPEPFQVNVVPVCTSIPPVMIFPVALVVNELLPVLGVCTWPLTVITPLRVIVLPASTEKLEADIVPLALELTVLFERVIVPDDMLNAAFIFAVAPDDTVNPPFVMVTGEPKVAVPADTCILPPDESVVSEALVLNVVVPLVNVNVLPLVPVIFIAAPKVNVLPTIAIDGTLIVADAADVTVAPVIDAVPLTAKGKLTVSVTVVALPIVKVVHADDTSTVGWTPVNAVTPI